MRIAIDAGHGINTPGKRTPDGIHEWSLNNDVANYIAQFLNSYATIIRTDDTSGQSDIPLADRRNKAINNADLLISIHHNALEDNRFTTATGVEVYSHTNHGTKQAKELAALLVNQISSNTGLRNRGAKQARFAVIATSQIPAVLCEGGFMDGRQDSFYIRTEEGKMAYAKAVADVVIKYFGLKQDNPQPNPEPQEGYTFRKFVAELQSTIGAKVDGIPGRETLSKTPTLSKTKNRKHGAVKPVQKYLYSIGYTEVGNADGIAGNMFDLAVKHFQRDNGCVVDGEITAHNKTWKKLLKLS